jgi:hypothetical protein
MNPTPEQPDPDPDRRKRELAANILTSLALLTGAVMLVGMLLFSPH